MMYFQTGNTHPVLNWEKCEARWVKFKAQAENHVKRMTPAKYDTFNHTLLLSPRYTKVSELSSMIMNGPHNCTYNYLVNLRYSDMIEDACVKREDELKELIKRLDELHQDMGSDEATSGIPKGGKTWLKEIDELEETVKLGLSKGWDYGENEAKFR